MKKSMKKSMKKLLLLWTIALMAAAAMATVPPLHVEGRYFKDDAGRVVNLHGFAQTFSPWFNEQGKRWTNYDVQGCLKYNKGIIDGILAAGWKMDFVRQHMDPYWSNTPGIYGIQENDIIVKLGDTETDSGAALSTAVNQTKPGDKVTVTVYRSGETLELTVTIGEETAEASAATQKVSDEITKKQQEAYQQEQQQQQPNGGGYYGWPFGSFGF